MNINYHYEFDGVLVKTSNIRKLINAAVHILIVADCTDRRYERFISIKNRDTGSEYRVYAFAHGEFLNIWLARWTGFYRHCKLRTVQYN